MLTSSRLYALVIGIACSATACTGDGKTKQGESASSASTTPTAKAANAPKPPRVAFDPTTDVGPDKHKVMDFVNNLETGGVVDSFIAVAVIETHTRTCSLYVAPIKGAFDIPKQPEGGDSSYVVALVENRDGCHPPKMNIPKGRRAAWLIRFDSTVVPSKKQVAGKSHFVVLGKGGPDGDEHLGGTKSYDLKTCGNTAGTVNSSTILTHTTVCDLPNDNVHDPVRVQQKFNAMIPGIQKQMADRMKMSARARDSIPFNHSDPSLWFGCGGDCCYIDF
jgi:hypothetical protein